MRIKIVALGCCSINDDGGITIILWEQDGINHQPHL